MAADHLKKAANYQPDDYEIQKELGKVLFASGESAPNNIEAFLLTQTSKDFYLNALRLNSLDAETVYALGRGEHRLEQLYRYLHPEEKETPYRPLPYFKQAVRLRPNGLQYNYTLARCFYNQGQMNELLAVVRRLTRICPSSYGYLKKENFWSDSVREACRTGLREAVKNKISVRNAHMIISSVLTEEKDWPGAISHYQEALNHSAFQNSSANYAHLGSLRLKNSQHKEAMTWFFHALDMSRSKEKSLERIYSFYKKEGCPEKFLLFYQQISGYFIFSSRADILLARFFFDLKQYQKAQEILTVLNQKHPTARAYYWLSRIAQAEKDWDRMELAIQKATVLDPKNSQYHFIFSNLLKRLKKLDRAEKEARLAIEHRKSPTAGLFNHSAWIRWSKSDYLGAIDDWKSAVRLKPDTAAFYSYIAEAYRRLENRALAMEYYQKATSLDPTNDRYLKRYLEIKAEI
ncbi:tetratricopeptide repeat protein [Desulfonema magnum]|uniref:tetratricopeptide repeat protein n=1 Tax=Desulfonema magnum TaxID=45655 RepID=UPI001A9AE5E1|nr:tetratricopeptide repeat protein [Desulfonema magnum]